MTLHNENNNVKLDNNQGIDDKITDSSIVKPQYPFVYFKYFIVDIQTASNGKSFEKQRISENHPWS